MRQKRIMILGGNSVQAEATQTAKRLGYHTISTDLHADNPGHAIADDYCPIDVVNKAEVMHEAVKMEIDGIVPYTSDILAPVAAYVAERMKLPGNPYDTVDIMTHKNRFRTFLAAHGFPTPRGKGFKNVDEAVAFLRSLNAPAMMKPVDSAGSKGVFKVSCEDDIRQHWDESMRYSAEKKIIIEDFIERKGLQQDGDIFVVDGRIAFWGVGDQHKDSIAPFVPAMLSFPSTMPEVYVKKAQQLVQEILKAVGFRQGPCNVEYMIGTDNEVYVLEIGPRNGGNLIPFALQECTGVDLTELTVRQAVGEKIIIGEWEYNGFSLAMVLHTRHSGIMQSIDVAERYKKNLRRTFLFKHAGDSVRRFQNGGDTIGTMTFHFDTRKEMEAFMTDSNAVTVTLQEEETDNSKLQTP